MDPELSFLQANLAQANHNSIILDPFCGTGGLLLAAAYFGSHVLGVEIQYDVARAVGRSARAGELYLGSNQSIHANFVQYGLESKYLGVILADSSLHMLWSTGDKNHLGKFDAIITDPPYGVRESAQKLGQEEEKHFVHHSFNDNNVLDIPKSLKTRDDLAEPQRNESTFFPSKTRYHFARVFLDLMNLASKLLRVRGRLAFWLPVHRLEYSDEVVPRHPCMDLVYNCEQKLSGDLSRRLLVYVKIREPKDLDEAAFFPTNFYDTPLYFRDRVFCHPQ